MNVYTLIPSIVFLAYLPLAIIALWGQPSKQRRLFYWYMFASLLWGASSILLNCEYLVSNKLAFCKFNITTFIWVAIQFYAFSRSYGQGKYTWLMGGAYLLLVLILILVILDIIPQSIVIGNGVSYSVGIWLIVIFAGLAGLTVENIRAQVLAFKGSSEPVQRKRNIAMITGICIMFLFSLPAGIVEFSHLPLGHIGNLIVASLWVYVLIGLSRDKVD
jgi:hypothetical protein